ncbi:MAG: dihydroorotate dehydrogenase electron transfer subunit [Methanolinea sp.]|nr:dihydroorotate dehydrogenase electron transfer subunit [Methanolinea sp.]
MSDGMPVPVRITRVARETPSVATFEFDREFSFVPGQFVMVWVPGVDEIPMALSSASSITVQRVGDATAALFRLGPGDCIGIRGPFGNGFPEKKRMLAVAGGVGAAPILPAVVAGGVDKVLLGARSRGELLFRERFESLADLSVATDDGSLGFHGFVPELLADEDISSFHAILVCGPERMMAAVLGILSGRGCPEKGYFSLHRYMKCGVGVCGSCCIDPGGLRVCRDGPVFSGDILAGGEFGRYSRDAAGRRRPV